MTDLEADPLTPELLERDQWGRAKIIPLTKRGKVDSKAKPVGYTRVSTLAEAISGAGGLIKFSTRHLALGLGHRPDLAMLAGSLPPVPDMLTGPQMRELDIIIERAHDASHGNVKADHGTVIHTLTEPDPLGYVPDVMAADIEAYQRVMTAAGLVVEATEQFVVNDAVTAAGTYDHKVRTTRDLMFGEIEVPAGTRLILDKKTGRKKFGPQAIQLATYANAKGYDKLTGERTDLDVSTQWGILAHIPKGEADAQLYLIDLTAGWAGAKVAAAAMEYGKRKDLGHTLAASFKPGDVVTPEFAQHAAKTAGAEPGDVITADMGNAAPPFEGTVTPPKRDIAAECQATEDAIKAERVAAQMAEAAAFAETVEANKAAATLKAAQDREAAEGERIRVKAEAAAARAVAAEREAEAATDLLKAELGATVILTVPQMLAQAGSREALAAIWRAASADGTWSDDYIDEYKARAALVPQTA